MTLKERVHLLVEELPERQLALAERLLKELEAAETDPVLDALLKAPIDDEPETEDERAAIDEALADLAAGRVISHDTLKRELGL